MKRIFNFVRVIILILVMLIIIPLLTVSDDDISQSLATQFIGQLAQLASTNATLYQVRIVVPKQILFNIRIKKISGWPKFGNTGNSKSTPPSLYQL